MKLRNAIMGSTLFLLAVPVWAQSKPAPAQVAKSDAPTRIAVINIQTAIASTAEGKQAAQELQIDPRRKMRASGGQHHHPDLGINTQPFKDFRKGGPEGRMQRIGGLRATQPHLGHMILDAQPQTICCHPAAPLILAKPE